MRSEQIAWLQVLVTDDGTRFARGNEGMGVCMATIMDSHASH